MSLDWMPQGSRCRGQPKTTWKRTVVEQAKALERMEKVFNGGHCLWIPNAEKQRLYDDEVNWSLQLSSSELNLKHGSSRVEWRWYKRSIKVTVELLPPRFHENLLLLKNASQSVNVRITVWPIFAMQPNQFILRPNDVNPTKHLLNCDIKAKITREINKIKKNMTKKKLSIRPSNQNMKRNRKKNSLISYTPSSTKS